ncbi:sugar phosphate isomerase/epimerase [Paenibacillus sp. CC-CFT747]|nr:sugar phosphate isomerase/epimerase [Paenibacillus sp. CC-CFT747]
MIMDRVGVLTDEVSPDFAEALDWIREQGLKHVEIRVVDGVNAAELDDVAVEEVNSAIRRHGLSVTALASPIFKCALDPSRIVDTGDTFGQKETGVEEQAANLERVIAIANKLGTRRIRIFSFWREQEPEKYFDEIVGHLKKAAALAEKEDVVLLLENEGSCNGGYASEVADLIRAVNSPSLRALWDPGNEAYGGREAFPAGYASVKDTLAHVHLKDAYRMASGSSRCVPLGSGEVAVVAQLKALLEDGYDGLFTIETHFVPAGGKPMTGTRMTLDALRALAAEL